MDHNDERMNSLAILGFIGLVMLVAGCIIHFEVKNRFGRILMIVGVIHIVPFLFSLWVRALL